ncbi:LemA protein [Serratia fonticola]|uniref:LemA protein n=1 Tax=Serratia fonticola TaxID=47917 RepID=A0A542D5D9_SERFO|nr:LemA family protein [Serratia fonticola]TQI79671.1 LemA protein [Serratia fonticola]TQI98303.1 LemA protein [Serratia fonticola]TVZ67831.1 LemA protein [Serratia fonticola]
MNHIIAIIILIVIGLIFLSVIIGIYNKLIALHNYVDKSFANIDVILKQRADEIPQLIAVLKQSQVYEKDLLLNLANLRKNYMNNSDNDQKVRIANDMSATLANIFSLAENYPKLSSMSNFTLLQKRVSALEDNIADRREFFNESVTNYNIGIQEFPNLILAKILGYQQKALLKISEGEKNYAGITF